MGNVTLTQAGHVVGQRSRYLNIIVAVYTQNLLNQVDGACHISLILGHRDGNLVIPSGSHLHVKQLKNSCNRLFFNYFTSHLIYLAIVESDLGRFDDVGITVYDIHDRIATR